MKLIVDASIVVKWLFAEAHSHEARQLLAPRIVLDAPDFILTEVANDYPVYDCVYLACAEAAAAPLVTADARLAQRAREACPTVDVWNVGEPEVVQRIAAAATPA